MENNEVTKKLQLGTSLCNGKYVVTDVIGSGGFGITYKVQHTMMNYTYAMKEFFIGGKCVRDTKRNTVMLQDITTELFAKFKRRFVEEAQLLAKLNHEHIVRIIDVFEENGTAYYVMQYIEGVNLGTLVRRQGRLDVGSAINYVAQLTEAVGYIHANNILHRDLKPDNILVTSADKVVLIDFGSARNYVNDQVQHHTALVSKGYAPPEQYVSESRTGNYTDIYAIGAVLYYCLTGVTPIDSSVRSIERLREPVEINSEIPQSLNDAIMKSLNLRPEDRYQTIEDFRVALFGGGVIEGDGLLTPDIADDAAKKRHSDEMAQSRERQRKMEKERQRLELEKLKLEEDRKNAALKEEEDWVRTAKSNTECDLRKFLKDYPNSKHKSEAQKLLNDIREQVALDNCVTIEGYEAFIAAYQGSAHVNYAKQKIEELKKLHIIQEGEYWEKCVKESSHKQYEEYLKHYPQGTHAAEALARIDNYKKKKIKAAAPFVAGGVILLIVIFLVWPTEEKAWRGARKDNTFESYVSFVDRYGNSDSDLTKEHLKDARDILLRMAGNDIGKLRVVMHKSEGTRVDTIAYVKMVNLLMDSTSRSIESFGNEFNEYGLYVSFFNRNLSTFGRMCEDGKASDEIRERARKLVDDIHSAIVLKYHQDYEGVNCDDGNIINDALNNLRSIKQFKGLNPDEEAELQAMIESAETKLKSL